MHNTNKILTIAICTYNRAEKLYSCLKSLAQQNINLDNINILIIDNNSPFDISSITKKFSDSFISTKTIIEYDQGLSNSRNRAIKECQTPWVAFLDDDAKIGYEQFYLPLIVMILTHLEDRIVLG